MSVIFLKTYDGESLYDLPRDINETMQPDNPTFAKIPLDENEIQKGIFTVKIEWTPK